MGYEENIKRDMALLLQSHGVDAQVIISWNDTTYGSGYCDTCYYESAAVQVYYTDSNGKSKSYLYTSDFSTLIYELDRLNEQEGSI